jgi:hypothetical protein
VCEADADGTGTLSDRGTVSALTGEGRITALPGVGGVVDVGAGREPQEALSTTPNIARMTARAARISDDLALRCVRGKLPRSPSFG